MAKQMIELIVETYRSSATERRRYHEQSLASNDPADFASRALFLLETPVSDLAGMASWADRLDEARRVEFLRQLRQSPLATSMDVQRRLRGEGALQMALVIERADHLRLVLINLLESLGSEHPAAKHYAL